MVKFAVRARAVDMLGRQQIAGIPTAIHELFKNAHDAYATRVEADFFRGDDLLVIRDNGLGMDREDFETRWLALGTESKLTANDPDQVPWTGPDNVPRRPVLGEKGIGRLAIATIAPITFVMSRAIRPDGKRELVAALVDWELFELPGVDVSAIDIPVGTYSDIPSAMDVGLMRSQIQQNAETILNETRIHRPDILLRLDAFKLDPSAIDEWFSAESDEVDRTHLTLRGEGNGTHFFLQPTDPILKSDIDDKPDRGATPLKRMLLGFGNTMAPDREPPITAEFRDHSEAGGVDELIGPGMFFTPDEMQKADHRFHGRFDEYGQFSGSLEIYNGDPQSYVLSWPEGGGRETDCGPFELHVSYVQGRASETLLSAEAHREIMEKLDELGGLYVYRDGIRILPYGNSDYDFLNIEQRRTLSAADWFFSYRRMFGYVATTVAENSRLIEKAGREGFRQNKAYRQFRSILEHFFRQLAVDYFKPSAEHGEEFRAERKRLRNQAELLQRRQNYVAERRRDFRTRLEQVLERFEADEPEAEVARIIGSLDTRLDELRHVDPEAKRDSSNRLESETRRQFDDLEETLSIPRPRTFTPSAAVLQAWDAYAERFREFRENGLENGRSEATRLLNAFTKENSIEMRLRDRAVGILQQERNQSMREIRLLKKQAEDEVTSIEDYLKGQLNSGLREFQNEVEGVMVDLQRADFDAMDEEEAFARQRVLERRIQASLNEHKEILTRILEQLKALKRDVEERTASEETTAALEEQVMRLQEQIGLYTDLAQAGAAVGIIGHEMENLVGGIRRALSEIKPWADATPGLGESFEKLRANFDHVDGYLALFAPLGRRVRRRKGVVTGETIKRYVIDVFEPRVHSESIELVVTDPFVKFGVEGFASTILAAFVNIIDNAVYWVSSSRESERWIKLDADSQGFLISNGGPGIPLRIANRIFEFGMSTKPGGRGMGLAISKDALAADGLALSLETSGTDTHPIFRIAEQSDEEGASK